MKNERFDNWIKGFEGRYDENTLWHMKWAFSVGENKLAEEVSEIIDKSYNYKEAVVNVEKLCYNISSGG
jgi:hypothetical protein